MTPATIVTLIRGLHHNHSYNPGQHMRWGSAALVFIALFVPFAYFNHSDGWNQGARLAELHAIVRQGTIRIDAYHQITGDKALIDGHYYSEKAPAVVLFALPSFAAIVTVQRLMGINPDAPGAWRVSEWIATAGSVGMVTALGGVAYFLLLTRRLGTPLALVGTYAVFLGSLAFPYATAMFAHAATVGLLAMVLWAVLDRPSETRDYVAGMCAGLAVATEYPAIIPCAALGFYLTHANPARAWRFGLGMAPGALLILGNNYLITGSLFEVAYGSNPAFPEIAAGNAFGFSMPDGRRVAALLWGEYRGLFFWSPMLLMAVPGLVELYREWRPLAAGIVTVFIFMVMQVAGFSGWSGGNAIGPRYLAPALPFLGIAAIYGIRRWPLVGAPLAAVSMALMGLVSAVAIDPPQDVPTPLQSFYLSRVQEGRFADNLGTLVGLPLEASLLVPMAITILAAAGALALGRRRTVQV
jgi:hypothetical protein